MRCKSSDNTKRLGISFKSNLCYIFFRSRIFFYKPIKFTFTSMTKWWVTNIMRMSGGFNNIWIKKSPQFIVLIGKIYSCSYLR